MKTSKKYIGNKIRQLREEKKYSQKKVAKDLGYESDTAIYLIEKGKRSLPIEKLKDVASYFGVSVEFLIDPNYQKDPITEIAYRAKNLSRQDKEKVEDFIEFLKQKNNEVRSKKKTTNNRKS